MISFVGSQLRDGVLRWKSVPQLVDVVYLVGEEC